MKSLISLVIIVSALFAPVVARADEGSHRKATEALLSFMEMESMLSQSIDQMLQLQVQQNPTIAPYQSEMKAFFANYMSWASLKDDMVSLYMTELTEPELKERRPFTRRQSVKRP